MLLFDAPPPAIVQAAEPWETRLSQWLARQGVPLAKRLAIGAEIRRVAGLTQALRRPAVLLPTAEDLARFGGVVGAFVPGMTGAVAEAQAAATAAISYRSQVAGDGYFAPNGSYTPNISGLGQQSGDLLLVCCYGKVTFFTSDETPASITPATPSGFTFVAGGSDGGSFIRICGKISAGNETTVNLGTANPSQLGGGNHRFTHTALAFSVAGVGSPSFSFGDATAAGNASAETIAASGGVVPLVALGYVGNITGSTFSPTEDSSIVYSTNINSVLKYKIFNSSPADVTHTPSSSTRHAEAYLKVN